MYSDDYIQIVTDTIRSAWDSQADTLRAVADTMANTIARKNSVYLFGCSHAGILAEEVFYRTGGLAVLNPIFFPALMLNTRPITMTSKLERISGLGRILVEENHLHPGDMLLVHSVSGRNTVPVEIAEEARARDVYVACITNLAYSRAVSSRHPGGKKLFEVCDAVIDNGGVPGDAAIRLEGLAEAVGPTSTAVGTALLNAVVVEAIDRLLQKGITPPVFLSANLDGGDEHNRAIFEQYRENIFYL